MKSFTFPTKFPLQFVMKEQTKWYDQDYKNHKHETDFHSEGTGHRSLIELFPLKREIA